MEEKARAACHSRACGGSFCPPRLTSDRLANGRSGARPHHSNWKRLISKSIARIFFFYMLVPSRSLGRLCLFLLFLLFALVGVYKRGAGLLCAVGAARQRTEQQSFGARSDFGALIGRLGKFGEAQLRNQARVPFLTWKRKATFQPARHEAASEPRSLSGQIR